MKQLNRFRVLLYILLALTIIEIAGYVTLAVLGVFEGDKRYLLIVFATLNPILLVAFFITLIRCLSLKSLLRELRSENIHNLGTESSFYNYHAFDSRVRKLRLFRHRNDRAYVLAFSATNQAALPSNIKNSVGSKLNYEIAQYITHYLENKGSSVFRANSFCRYHNLFIIYTFMDKEFVEEFIRNFENDIFKIVEEKQIHVFVQPFFGISEVINPKEDVYESVDNAITAYKFSEKSFQAKTYYEEEHRKGVSESEIIEITDGIKNNEFEVYYQPKFSLATNEFISSEALVRWNSPKYGLIAPNKFISKAEIGGVIHEIDMFVFKRVCEDISETKIRGKRVLPVSVNFSLYEFYVPNFLDDLMTIIDTYKLDPKYIEIEITETTSQANSFLAVSLLKKIKEQGIKLLMDDFGIGYSNINNLNKLPFDKVKIDKSLIDNLVDDEKTRESIRYLISLCKINNLESIAEGVDNEKQVEILKKMKCDTIQGFYYSKPIPKKEYEQFLLDNKFEKKAKGGKKK